jgi:predicted transcriptional regulator
MISQKQNRGIGFYQMERDNEARNAIYEVLSDGQWHRIKELKERTKISPTTLYSKLESLEELTLIKRKEDIEKGKYAILYKAIPEMLTVIRVRRLTKEINQTLEQILVETKDHLFVLDTIHLFSQLGVLTVLKSLSLLKKKNRNISWELVEFFEETLIWHPYKSLTLNLIASSMKTVDDIDMNQLLISQTERKKEESKMDIKKLEELRAKYMLNLLS